MVINFEFQLLSLVEQNRLKDQLPTVLYTYYIHIIFIIYTTNLVCIYLYTKEKFKCKFIVPKLYSYYVYGITSMQQKLIINCICPKR